MDRTFSRTFSNNDLDLLALDSTEILRTSSVLDDRMRIHESSSNIALTPSIFKISDDSAFKTFVNLSRISVCTLELTGRTDLTCRYWEEIARHSSTVVLANDAIVALAKKPSLHMLKRGKIKPALLPSPPASAPISSIVLTTFASPTSEEYRLQ